MSLHKIHWIDTIAERLDSVSPSFCLAKWTQTTIYLNSGFTHSCHHPQVHKIPLEGLAENPGQIHNTPHKQQLRQMMLNGERPDECDYCWRIEDLGKGNMSDRHYKSAVSWSNPHFDEIVKSGTGSNFAPRYLEVLFESTCNFACSYCSPEVSSKWWADVDTHGPYKLQKMDLNSNNLERIVSKEELAKADDNPYVQAFWKVIPDWWPTLHTFRITGGEPLLSKHTWKMLDFVKERANPCLSFAINTNLGVPDSKIDELILNINAIRPQLKNFIVYTSFEATGKQAEYIRFGMDYGLFLNNVKKILGESTADLSIMTTISALSYSTFKDFVLQVIELKKEFGRRILVSFNYLRWPTCMDTKFLPDPLKQRWIADIDELVTLANKNTDYFAARTIDYVEAEQLERFKNYLMAPVDGAEQTFQNRDLALYLHQLDARRSLDRHAVFPELMALL